jgi:hypothetical protein
MKKFNVQPTLEAFIKVRPQMTGKSGDLLTLRVHESMLEGKFLQKNANYLRKTLKHLEETSAEVLYSTFIGKLSLRMPAGITKGKWDDFQKEEMKKIGAALLINVLVDSGEYEMVSRSKRVDPVNNNGRSFVTHLFLVFQGVSPTKELMRGLETEPGIYYQKRVGDVSLTGEFKYMLSQVSSMAFKTSDVISRELIMHGYKLSDDYNSTNPGGFGEPRALKKDRYGKYADLIMDQITRIPKFYLPMKYDGVGRMYYLFQLVGLRPQGHLWETLFIDAFEPKVLDQSAIDHLKHLIYVTKYGRCSLEQAVAGWSTDDLTWAIDIDAFATTTEKEFGEAILVNKAAKAMLLTIEGKPCHYLFGKDLTNSGLMMAGANFKSPKMLKASNLRKLKTVHDSYADMQKVYGLEHLTRKNMKAIATPMMHGAAISTMLKNVQSALRKNGEDEHTVNTVDLQFVNGANHEAFGPEVDNIFAISSWGNLAVSNTQTKLYWTSPDGFKACYRSHIKFCPVIINAATAGNKAGYRESKLVFDMPLKQEANGRAIHEKGLVAHGSKQAVQVKKFGLYAGMTHGMDSSLLRKVVKYVIGKGEVCLLKHDDYMTFPDVYDDIIEVGKQFFVECSDINYYQQALNQVAANGSDMPPMPELKVGDGKVEDTVNFLMP